LRKIDIHNKNHRLKLVLERVNSEVSENNRRAILGFYNSCVAEGLSVERTEHYLQILVKLSRLLGKNFVDASKDDIVSLMTEIQALPLSEWTKHDYKVTLKKFYKWLRGGEDYPEEVKWIKTTIGRNDTLPEELLTEEDVKALIEAADHIRDKALISVLYDAGLRIGELLSLRIRHVKFDQRGATLIVYGKTGMRRLLIIASAPHLLNWINNHPFRDDPDAPLWVGIGSSNKNQPLDYGSVRMMLRRTARKAGLKKAVNPHLFRHSRATYLAKYLTEAQMCEYFGWVQGSRMPSIYVHLSGRDVDGALLKIYGMEEEEKVEEPRLKPRKCPRCGYINSADAKYCNKCGLILDVDEAMRFESVQSKVGDFMSMLLEDPKIKAIIESKVREVLKKGHPNL